MKYCKNCGKEVETIGTNYCPNCGAVLSVSEDKAVKSLKFYEFETFIFALVLLISPFVIDFFSKEVDGKLGNGYYTSISLKMTRHYSFLDAIALNDKKYLVMIFTLMITALVIYCILKLCFIFLNKNTVVFNKVFRIYHIVFIVLSLLFIIFYIISDIIIFKLNAGLKPGIFFFLYSFISLAVSFADISHFIPKKTSKSGTEEQ